MTTVAVPEIPLAVAVTSLEYVPATAVPAAVNNPLELMDPTATCVFVHVNVGWTVSALPAISSAVAVKLIVPLGTVVPGFGVTMIFAKLPV